MIVDLTLLRLDFLESFAGIHSVLWELVCATSLIPVAILTHALLTRGKRR